MICISQEHQLSVDILTVGGSSIAYIVLIVQTLITFQKEIFNLGKITFANMKTANVLLLYAYVLYAIPHPLLMIMKKALGLNAEDAKQFL